MTPQFDSAKIVAWVKEAGALALRYYQTQLTRTTKADFSPVTEADQAVESFLLKKLRRHVDLNHHGIVAEETGGNWQNKEFIWTVDPIDGTRVFIDGLPTWCITIGLLRQGEPYRGVVYLPVTGELFYTDDEGTPFWNNRPLAGMLRTEWDRDSFMAVPSAAHRYYNINFHRVRALGATATHHVYVARGATVAALHRKAKIWDLAGAHAILTAAGGQAVYLDGTPPSMLDILREGATRDWMLVGHPRILEQLRPRISAKPKPEP